MFIRAMPLSVAGLVAVGAAAPRVHAQVSEFYLTTHGNGPGDIYVVQNGIIQRQWSSATAAGSLFVTSTVRTAGNGGGAGEEFTLAGVPTGTTFPAPGTVGMHVDDSTTDGNYAYGFDYVSQELKRFDLDWSNPTTQFSVGAGHDGVTYDRTDGTFWLCGWELAQIEHVTAAGVLLGSFPTTTNNTVGLGLDPADNTLWLVRWGTGIMEQYSKTGTLLQSQAVIGLSGIVAGGEFALVPTPGAGVLLVVSVLGTARRRR